MFIAMYEFEVRPGCEQAFQKAWLEVTKTIYKRAGSLGSRLHRAGKNNLFVAYAQWPSEAHWQSLSEIQDESFNKSKARMRSYLERSETVYELNIAEDFLKNEAAESSGSSLWNRLVSAFRAKMNRTRYPSIDSIAHSDYLMKDIGFSRRGCR